MPSLATWFPIGQCTLQLAVIRYVSVSPFIFLHVFTTGHPEEDNFDCATQTVQQVSSLWGGNYFELRNDLLPISIKRVEKILKECTLVVSNLSQLRTPNPSLPRIRCQTKVHKEGNESKTRTHQRKCAVINLKTAVNFQLDEAVERPRRLQEPYPRDAWRNRTPGPI